MKKELAELVISLQEKGLDDASLLAAKLYKKAQAMEEFDEDEETETLDMFDDTNMGVEGLEDDGFQASCMYFADTLMDMFDLQTIESQETFSEEIFAMCERHEPPEEFVSELATFIKALMEESP